MNKHTPGPWNVSGMPIGYDECINADGPKLVAKINNGRNEYKANARLIASAPEMYEALKEAQKELFLLNVDKDGTQKKNTPASLVIHDVGVILAKVEA